MSDVKRICATIQEECDIAVLDRMDARAVCDINRCLETMSLRRAGKPHDVSVTNDIFWSSITIRRAVAQRRATLSGVDLPKTVQAPKGIQDTKMLAALAAIGRA